MDLLSENIIFTYSFWALFALTVGYFLILYFGVGTLFLGICKFLEKRNILEKIEKRVIKKKQIGFEIKHSVQSIIVFGFSILPIAWLIRTGKVELLPNTVFNIVIGLVILTLWNEVHFYLVHRLMHTKMMMKNFHFIHHKSTIPSVYSVFSFHWVEALLLSTVPLIIIPFIPFALFAVFLFPLVSILLNFSGHCNYRFGKGKGEGWMLLGTHHNQHHAQRRKNYGFALNFLDKIFSNQDR